MPLLILGLMLFLGVHSIRIVADGWRTRFIGAAGEPLWKAAYSLLAVTGLVLVIQGYAEARLAPVVLWSPPLWTRHAAALLALPAFVLLAAAYVPGTRVKRAVGHPMVLGVAIWAGAHLLANGTLADALLFGAFSCGPPRTTSRRGDAIVPGPARTRREARHATCWRPAPVSRSGSRSRSGCTGR
jgi:uncharacterized membrane protein